MFRRMGRKNLKGKEVRKMKTLTKVLMVLAVVGLVGVTNVWGVDTSTQTVTITVTPITVSMFSISPDTYDFGSLDLAISSNSASGTGICPIIQNNGDVGLSLEKTVWSISSDGTAWSLATSTGTDEFVLWAMTNGETGLVGDRPAVADFDTGGYELSKSSFSINTTVYNDLTKETDGLQTTLTPNGEDVDSAALWFRIDMPSAVSKSDQQSIVVKIRATTQ